MMPHEVILVNEQDEPIGVMEKMEAHQTGALHRAFSVFIFNSRGEMLLQQRASVKYHSPDLWTNACCSHPKPGEITKLAAVRRLQEELGFFTELTHRFSFVYKAKFDNGLIEHEFDHVFTGVYDGTIEASVDEVQGFAYRSIEDIETDLELHPEKYTAWFHLAFPQLTANSDNYKLQSA